MFKISSRIVHTLSLTRDSTHLHSVFSFSRDRSRCGIISCNPKNQIWDKSRNNQWYLSHSGCAIKSGIHTTFLAHNCGSTARLGSRRIHAESHQTRIGQVAPRRVHELVQRTLDGSVQRPSPEADRARPAATVPPWIGQPATKIPVDKIAEEWRSQSSKGRYESAMWREAGLEGRAPT